MPMGLKNSPNTFQRLMDQVLLEWQSMNLLFYLDDIIVFAKNLEDRGISRLLVDIEAIDR